MRGRIRRIVNGCAAQQLVARRDGIAPEFIITTGCFNELFRTHPDSKIIQTVLLLLLSIVVVMRDRDFFLRREYK